MKRILLCLLLLLTAAPALAASKYDAEAKKKVAIIIANNHPQQVENFLAAESNRLWDKAKLSTKKNDYARAAAFAEAAEPKLTTPDRKANALLTAGLAYLSIYHNADALRVLTKAEPLAMNDATCLKCVRLHLSLAEARLGGYARLKTAAARLEKLKADLDPQMHREMLNTTNKLLNEIRRVLAANTKKA